MPPSKTLFTALLIFASLLSSAQIEFGFSAGLNLANAKEEINEEMFTHSYLSRFNIGADLNYSFDENWGLQTGLYYAGKGWRERYSLGYDTVVTRLNYIQLPLKVSYRFQETSEKSITVSGGFYGAYGISGKTTFRNDPDLAYDPFATKYYKRFDLGYLVESAYRITNKYGAKLSYSHGLLSLKRPDDKLKNFLFNASLFVVIKY